MAEDRERRRARERLRGHPQQRLRRVKAVQEEILAELPAATREQLRAAGFTTTPAVQRVDPTKGTHGWEAPGPPVLAGIGRPVGRTIVRVGEGGQPVRWLQEPLKPVLRHEIGHFILAAREVTYPHHPIQEPRGTRAGLARLGRLPAPLLWRMEQRRRTPKLVSQQGVATASRPEFRGFQTEHLAGVAREGTEKQRKRARAQMRRLGQRMRQRGVDF